MSDPALTTDDKRSIAREMREARDATLRLFDVAREEHLRESPGFGFRPVIWHLAHIGVFEGYWLLQKLRGLRPADAYYERVFDPIATPREESKDLPTRREMEDYLARVRAGALDSLEEADFHDGDALARGGYVFRLVLEHERQHQETLAYLLQMLDPSKKTRPARARRGDDEAARANAGANTARSLAGPPAAPGAAADVNEANADTCPPTSATRGAEPGEAVTIQAGAFLAGSVWDSFAYDNELPAHELHVPAFRLDRLPTTNPEYAEFVAEGGYRRREFWGEEGWGWREREAWEHPLYWTRGAGDDADGGGWRERRMFDEGPLEPAHPVVGVSWYEAEAYARFRGRRLPTEAEWEKAASWDAGRGAKRRHAWGDAEPSGALCNFDLRRWGTSPVGSFPGGATPEGCLDMTGNVWEWTATAFDAFPGFEPFPYPEYSQTWFDADHRVLKGGSWATSGPVLRTSFRNFFRRHFRIAFAGIRLASDA